MRNDMKAILYYLTIDHKQAFFIFWSIFILSATFLLGLSVAFSIDMTVSISASTYIFCGIAGFQLTRITFPYSIKFGLTRTRYVIGIAVFCLLLGFIMSLSHVVVTYVLYGLTDIIGASTYSLITTLEATSLAFTWYNMLLVDAVICSFIYSVALLIGTVFYRLGLFGGFVAVALLVVNIFIPTSRNWLIDTFVSVASGQVQLNIPFLMVILTTLLLFIPIWLILRKASTTAKLSR